MVTNIDNYNNYNLFGYNVLSSIYAPSMSYLWGIVTGSCITGSREPAPEMKGRYFPPLFPRIFRSFFHRNFSRLYVRTMELWIQHVSGHYCDITPYSYVKPFFESMIYYGSYRNTCLNRKWSIPNRVNLHNLCCLIKDLSLLFYYSKYCTIHMGFNTLF